MQDDPATRWALDHYPQAREQERLNNGAGRLEFARTVEILEAHLPEPPARVADIGAGAGPYSVWLAERGHDVFARDIVPLHVEQLTTTARSLGLSIDAAVEDARGLTLADDSVDAVLLLGPMYHLTSRTARLECLREASRICRAGGTVAVAAISRWAVLFDGVLRVRLLERYPHAAAVIDRAIATGVLEPLEAGGFAGYVHRPEELREEVEEAGLAVVSMQSVEGAGAYLPDLEQRWAEPAAREAVLDVARRCAEVPELLGMGSHLLVVATVP